MNKTYCRSGYETKQAALNVAQGKTRQHADGDKQVFAVVEGPEEAGFSVVDLATAIDLGIGYSW